MSETEPFLIIENNLEFKESTENLFDQKCFTIYKYVLNKFTFKFINIKNFLYLIVVCVFLTFIFSNFLDFKQSGLINIYKLLNFNNQDDYINYIYSNSSNKTQSSNLNCSPINLNYNQFKVNLDGSEYPKSVPIYNNKSINFTCLNSDTNLKRILLWNTFFGDKSYSYGLGIRTPFEKNNCPVTNCELTNDKNKLIDSDLVVVHMRDSISKVPITRPDRQRWVFFLLESPPHSGDFSSYNNFFNLTSTYRIGSEFGSFYEGDSNFYWSLNSSFNESFDYYSAKTDFAAAVISNCGGSSKRLEYIKQLQKHISVNVFGRCGKTCPNRYKDSTPGSCKEILAKEYKFYLAFENSICKDYITEKFFQILNYNIIPVVLGGGNYEYYIPKSGFINVKDFQTPKHLADYLIYLDNNKTAYNSYFKWKKYVKFDFKTPNMNPICQMCIKLHLESFYGIKQGVIEDLNSYWKKNMCAKPTFLEDNKFHFEFN